MRTAAGVVLDSINDVRPRTLPHKVNRSYPPLRTTTAMPHGDSSVHITTTLSMTLLGNRQGQERPPLPEMVVDGSPQVTDTRGSRLVGSDDLVASLGRLDDLDDGLVGDAVLGCRGLFAGDGGFAADGCVGSDGGGLAEGEGLEAPPQGRELEPWLEHDC